MRSRIFFFFKAEDGIRYLIVTGVQTCALPIPRRCRAARAAPGRAAARPRAGGEGGSATPPRGRGRSEEHTSELQSRSDLVCRLLLEKKKQKDKLSCVRCRARR